MAINIGVAHVFFTFTLMTTEALSIQLKSREDSVYVPYHQRVLHYFTHTQGAHT